MFRDVYFIGLFWHVCFSGMFNCFLLSVCFMSIHVCGQMVVFFVVTTTGRVGLLLSNAVWRRSSSLLGEYHDVHQFWSLSPLHSFGLLHFHSHLRQVVVFFVVATTQLRLSNAVQRRHDNGVKFFACRLSALTTSSIYTCSVLLRPGTFPLLHRHRACDLRAGAAFFVVHRLQSSTNSPRFVQ